MTAGTRQASNEVINGRYELLNAIGHGGMGTVYRARQLPIDRDVAVKVLRRSALGDDGSRAVKRFLKEARAIASLHHPHIISLYDFGQAESGDLYLVMELLPGRSLGEVIHQERRLPLRRAVRILDQILDGLQEAHRNDIVHRDLKPDNVQLGRRGDRDDFVTVLDFGIARKQDIDGRAAADSTTIEVCGTPAYMSPEQILGTAVDPRSDIYAAGVLLYEMLTGEVPFDSERTIDVYIGHLRHEVPRLKDVAPDAAHVPGLQELLDRVLAKAAEDRIRDVGTFRRAIRSIAGLTGRTASRPSAGSSGAISALDSDVAARGYDLVAAVDPSRSPGVDDLIEQWAVDVAQMGGTVRERRQGLLIASFRDADDASDPLAAALAMKQRTRAQRLNTLRPLYIRVGIHEQPSLAQRLCDEAPRDGLVIGAECIDLQIAKRMGKRLRLEPAGELRIRGQRGPVRMLQVLSGR